jgi:mannose-6-phosphate isomerase-like protein (cupin superfamily)
MDGAGSDTLVRRVHGRVAGAAAGETRDCALDVQAGQAVHAPAGEWVRYSTPGQDGAEYVAVCVPAFSPDAVHRDA